MSELRFQGDKKSEAAKTTYAPERKRGFSEGAKQNLLERAEALKGYWIKGDFLSGWPSFASMVELHEDIESGLLKEPEVIQVAEVLIHELTKQDTEEAQERIHFLKGFIVSPLHGRA